MAEIKHAGSFNVADLLTWWKFNMADLLKLREKDLYKGNSDRRKVTHLAHIRSDAGMLLVVELTFSLGNDAIRYTSNTLVIDNK